MCDNQTKLIREAFTQSEKNLESDISLAMAADQRAMGFCGWMVAAAALLIGLAESSKAGMGELYLGAIYLIIAAILAGYSAMPIKMRAPGAKFSDLETDIEDDVPLNNVLKEMGAHNDSQSAENRRKLALNGKLIMRSYAIASLGLSIPIISKLLELITWICGETS